MKPEDNVKKLYEKAAVNTNPEMDKTVLNKILAARKKPNIWRIIMKSPVTKLTAAAIVIAGVFILFVYSTDGQSSQQNRELHIATSDGNNGAELSISSDNLAENLILANRLFENNDISGLSQLLNNEFEAVQFQAAEYLGQIGDETVLAELQVLSDKWDGLEKENVFENAIINIKNRLTESQTNNETPSIDSYQEPNILQTITDKIIDETERTDFQGSYDDEDEDNFEEREPVLFGTIIDMQGNPVTGSRVYSSYANFGITNNNGEFELLPPPTDGSGSIGTSDFPMFVWSLTDDPYKIAWTLIRDPEIEEGSKTEETHQGVELIIEDENDLFINTPGVPGEFLDIDGDINVKDIVLVMEPAGVISGQVRGIEGQPLANTVVRVEELYMQLGINELIVNEFDQNWKPGPECITNDQGYYTLNNIPDCWSKVYLSINAPGFVKTYKIVTKDGDWNIQSSINGLEQSSALQSTAVPESIERPEPSIIPYDEDEDVHFPDAITDGYPLQGGKNSISEVVPNYLKNNLVLYYSFYDVNDPKIVTDISGNENHGFVENACYKSDEILGGVMNFEGDNDYLILPSLYLDKFTFGAWINPETTELNNRRIFLLDDGRNYYAIQGNGRGSIGAYITENLEINEYDYELKAGKWVYITVTFDSNTVCIYINGQLIESGTRVFSGGISGNAYIGFSGHIAGNERHDMDHYWQGMIEEVALFNRALTAEEVEQLFLMTGTYIQ